MDLHSIRKFIGNSTLFERGHSYYKSARVKSYRREENRIEASVAGSGMRTYTIQIKLDTSDMPTAAFCTCPYASGFGRCKHIAAVLIHDLEENQHRENPILFSDEFEYKPVVVNLNTLKGTNKKVPDLIESFHAEIDSFHTERESRSKKKERKRRFQLVFIIDEENGYYGSADSRWIIYPACRYIKMSGEPGRVERFDQEKISEQYGLNEKILLNRLIQREHKRDILLHYIDFLLRNDIPSLYLKKPHGYSPVLFEKIKTVDVRFLLDELKEERLFFVPELDIIGEYNHAVKGFHSLHDTILSGLSVLMVNDDGRIFFDENNPLLYNLLLVLFHKVNYFTYNEIERLKELISHSSSNIHIRFDAKTLKMRRFIPKPFIELEEKYGYLNIDLCFGYENSEVSYSARGDVIVEKSWGKEYTVVLRNHEYERKVYNFFSSRFRSFIHKDYPSNSFRAYTSSINFLLNHGREIIDERIDIRLKGEKQKISGQGGKIALSVNSGIDWFDVKVEHLNSHDGRERIHLTPSLLEKGLIRVGNTYTIVTKEDIEKLQRLLEEGMNSRGELRISKYNFHFIHEFYADIVNNQESHVIAVQRIADQLKDFDKIENYALPHGFIGKLRHYQRAGYNWLFFLHDYELNGCLADDMGLGKTVQTLVFLQSLKERKRISPSLIIVPVNTIVNWENEIQKFTPKLSFILHYGIDREKDEESLRKYDLIITSYHILRNDIELFTKLGYRYAILDESQFIKNSNSLLFKTVRLLNAERRLSLTGTPIENNVFELWSQMEFLNPGMLGTRTDFKKKFARPIEAERDEKATERLKRMIYPFILRRKKEEVIRELPSKSEIVLYSEMEGRQSALYNRYRDYYRAQIQSKIERDGIKKSAIEIFTALLKLRQIALFPRLADKKHRNIQSCKFEQLKNIVEEILQEKHKIIIFSQFVESLAIMKDYFEKEAYRFSYIDGAVPAGKRMKEIKNFQEKEEIRLFLLSLKAGGIGVNLTSADYVILFDPWWNPAVENQAIDRAHRIGQTQKVIAYKMIVKDTVEEKILQLQEKKKSLVRELITSESSFFKSLSKKDIIGLF